MANGRYVTAGRKCKHIKIPDGFDKEQVAFGRFVDVVIDKLEYSQETKRQAIERKKMATLKKRDAEMAKIDAWRPSRLSFAKAPSESHYEYERRKAARRSQASHDLQQRQAVAQQKVRQHYEGLTRALDNEYSSFEREIQGLIVELARL